MVELDERIRQEVAAQRAVDVPLGVGVGDDEPISIES
jgi:hypothetical protein